MNVLLLLLFLSRENFNNLQMHQSITCNNKTKKNHEKKHGKAGMVKCNFDLFACLRDRAFGFTNIKSAFLNVLQVFFQQRDLWLIGIYLFICLFIYLFIYLFTYLFIYFHFISSWQNTYKF